MKKSLETVQLLVRHVVNQAAEYFHYARAYKPVSSRMMPKWRNLGTPITPYHFYLRPLPVVISRQTKK